MEIKKYIFIKEFTKYPGGRYEKDGPFSGEQFRKEVLEPVFSSGENIKIDFSGVLGVPPSFIDESFAEIAKKYGKEKFIATVEILSDDNSNLFKQIMIFVNKATR